MPTYVYRCAKCGEQIEAFQSFADAPLTKHTDCGGKLSEGAVGRRHRPQGIGLLQDRQPLRIQGQALGAPEGVGVLEFEFRLFGFQLVLRFRVRVLRQRIVEVDRHVVVGLVELVERLRSQERVAPGAAARMRAEIGVFGGSGFYTFGDGVDEVVLETPFGAPSAPVTIADVGGRRVAFIPRHGRDHEFAPARVPARANLWAMRMLGVRQVIGPCAAGSLSPDIHPGDFVVLDQLVDRTWGRPDTFYDAG